MGKLIKPKSAATVFSLPLESFQSTCEQIHSSNPLEYPLGTKREAIRCLRDQILKNNSIYRN